MSLLYWLPMTDGTAKNQGLSNPTMTNTNITSYDSGKLGKCCSFNGTDSRILVEDTTNIGDILKEDFTICFWVYDAKEAARSCYFTTYNLDGVTAAFSIEKLASRGFRLYWAANPDWASITTIPDNTWVHIAVVHKNNNMYVYINGDFVSKNETGTWSADKLGVLKKFALGRDYRTSTPVLLGYMNDFRIYNEALSPREIKEISKALVLHYTLSSGGGENLVIDSANKTVSHLTSGNEYIAINLGQSYMDIPSNTQVTISFDLEMKIGQVNNIFIIYNTNNKGPKQISSVSAAPQIYTDVEVGDIVKKRIYVVTNIVDRDSPTTTDNYIEFYSQYNTGNVFKISNLKIEVGNKATPWTPNSADPEYSAMGYDDPIEYDVSGYGNNGTKVGNITYNTDSPRYETSAYFNGSSDIRSAKSSFGWFDFNEGTVAAWYKPANTTQTWASVGVQNDGGAGSRSFSVCNYSGKAGTVVGYDSSWGYLASGYSMDANVWYHLCATITNADTVKLYVNGELVQTRTVTNTTGTIASTTQFAVGVDLPGSDERYTGQLSDVRFYATALSADDIKALYQIPVSLSSDGTLFAGEYVEE